ncbi:MAG: 4-hydroxy-tetrahydrodipicolinate synthase [Candidatus Omnitrophica bacterium 4484_49]|nr:MAG: 4-hydroxy-tetrahydrodipicolinate synthase [Candidatus Omnitrophica bacterium 4484_49]
MFRGSMVALVTPFKNGKVDKKTLKKLVRFHIKNNTSALVPCGTTGESATLSYEEHEMVIDIVIQEAGGRIPVIAGTGSNSTWEAIKLTRFAKKAGADGALLICPYYNKPTQNGLYEHFKAIAEEVDIPLILYNIPSRTGINMAVDTISKLAKDFKNIVGVKEASGNLDQMINIRRNTPDNFLLISGDDALTLPVLSIGGKGVISVLANIMPKEVEDVVRKFEVGDVQGARELHLHLYPLIKAMFLETNPIPVKTAMGMMGLISPELRLPLAPMSDKNKNLLRKILKQYRLLA